jgi:hypothetical protein
LWTTFKNFSQLHSARMPVQPTDFAEEAFLIRRLAGRSSWLSSAGCGVATPQVMVIETGNRASIRTCSGRGVVGFRVHDLIQCFHFVHGEKDEMLLSCSRTGLALTLLLTAHRSHLKVVVLTHHRSHLKSSKLFHLEKRLSGRFHAACASWSTRRGS